MNSDDRDVGTVSRWSRQVRFSHHGKRVARYRMDILNADVRPDLRYHFGCIDEIGEFSIGLGGFDRRSIRERCGISAASGLRKSSTRVSPTR
jgi:hypothetical protein